MQINIAIRAGWIPAPPSGQRSG